MTALSEMKTIRVLVQGGRGYGHARSAITAMLKLRDAGFKGIFDLYCQNESTMKTIAMLGLEKPPEEGESVDSPVGLVKIKALDREFKTDPEPADLSITVGESFDWMVEGMPSFLTKNTPHCVSLSPTDFCTQEGRAHINTILRVDEHGKTTPIEEIGSSTDMRLSAYSNIDDITPPHNPSKIEGKAIDIVQEAKGVENCRTQLLYGMYPPLYSMETPRGIQRFLYLTTLNMRLADRSGKSVIMMLPQNIMPEGTPKVFERIKGCLPTLRLDPKKFHFIDLTSSMDEKKMTDLKKLSATPGNVVLVYTGPVQYQAFDFLMKEVDLVIAEGCSTRETAAATGIKMLHFPEADIQPYVHHAKFLQNFLDSLVKSAVDKIREFGEELDEEDLARIDEEKKSIIDKKSADELSYSFLNRYIEDCVKVRRGEIFSEYMRDLLDDFINVVLDDSGRFKDCKRFVHSHRPDAIECALDELEIDHEKKPAIQLAADSQEGKKEGFFYDKDLTGFKNALDMIIDQSRRRFELSQLQKGIKSPSSQAQHPKAGPAAGPVKESSHGAP